MRYRRGIVVTALVSFVFPVCMQNSARASDIHSTTTARLHQAAQASHARVAEARQAMDSLLARRAVQDQLRRVGVAPSTVRSRIAVLTDSEIIRLHGQLMTPRMQQASGGLSRGAIIAIVVAVPVSLALVVGIVAWVEGDND